MAVPTLVDVDTDDVVPTGIAGDKVDRVAVLVTGRAVLPAIADEELDGVEVLVTGDAAVTVRPTVESPQSRHAVVISAVASAEVGTNDDACSKS